MKTILQSPEFWITLVVVIFIITLLVNYRITLLKRQLTDLKIRLFVNQRAQAMEHQALLEQLRQQGGSPRTMQDLQALFGDKVTSLTSRYPSLTELDVQVLVLIGLGVENHEILRLTNMSKRTYYKRRQLIAQRMGTTAAQLDAVVRQLFTSN
ncbi:MAG: hypothetical protein IJT12_08285 [Paludibacteraceae bacterium]|nr:hypothetical protein [Paludibacteraceae bacterium]